MNFEVVISEAAERDVRKIVDWIRGHSVVGGNTWFYRWLEVLDSLADSADSCGLAPEDEDHEVEIRQIVFKTRSGKPYRAIFLIERQQVVILHVRGPGQDLIARDDLLFP